MSSFQSNPNPSSYSHTTKVDLAIATSVGTFAFACYGIVCGWLVYLSRKTKNDEKVKQRVFIFSLCTCVARIIQYCALSVLYFNPQDEAVRYIHAFVTISGDACLVNSLFSVFFSWIRLLRTYFSSSPPTYTPQYTRSVILLLRIIAITNFTIASIFIIVCYVIEDEIWVLNADLAFGSIFLVGLLGMSMSGFTLKKKLREAGCANMRALQVVKVMSILTVGGVAIFTASVTSHWYRADPQSFVFVIFLRIFAELSVISCYIYFIGNKYLCFVAGTKPSSCFTLSALRKLSDASAIQMEIIKLPPV